jgi:hypothetical protein
VTVELRPVNNRTWGIVHSKAHNPRVSTSQPLQHKLSSLINVLQNRWQSRDHRIVSFPTTNELFSMAVRLKYFFFSKENTYLQPLFIVENKVFMRTMILTFKISNGKEKNISNTFLYFGH